MRRLKKGLLLLFLIILAVAVWFPLAFLLGGSFMGTQEVLQKLGPVLGDMKGFASWSLIPQYPTLRPYVELLLDSPQFFVMFWNSVRLTAGVLFGQMIVGVPAAWGFARYDFPGKGALFTLYIVLMLMPFQVTMVSNYLVLNRLSLLDTHMGIILPAVFSTFPVFIMYRFFRGIPRSLIESARLFKKPFALAAFALPAGYCGRLRRTGAGCVGDGSDSGDSGVPVWADLSGTGNHCGWCKGMKR